MHRRGKLIFIQSGSGKSRLVRSAQLRHIWRGAANIRTRFPMEEMKEDGLEQQDGKCIWLVGWLVRILSSSSSSSSQKTISPSWVFPSAAEQCSLHFKMSCLYTTHPVLFTIGSISAAVGNRGGGGKGGGGRAAAPVIMTVCRNVHANTPYCIWNSIMDRIFKLKTEVRA